MHSGQFGCLTKLGGKQAELVQKFVPRRRVGIFRNERTRSTPLDLHSILVHLGSFRNYMKLGAKRGELVQLMQKLSREVMTGFSQQTHPIHPGGT